MAAAELGSLTVEVKEVSLSTSVSPGVGRLAIVVGLVAVASVVSLTTFFAIEGGPFGAINDIGNGTLAALSAGNSLRTLSQ